ncbi:uncharacterized protein MELLADRAFT_70515 [Melampsora larici-populina 98AG31]|uniref:NAD(P)-binding protein n=1 Tax=Melampsora larici-populina (strain 98AG31 / pathotype 3-4-7) TaxID=747676 RepID=F4R4H9_MELLP|nr:uncharacterized protein MELLADRAFT_70515 [Melampsora larici-populina 98AG31]EGG12998.1 hypothetical protein MELLADRAFT_70515 [Melampsora larici-populina 98AG31]
MRYSVLPKASHPPNQSTILANKLQSPLFPYARFSSNPSLSYTLENLLISALTVVTSSLDFLFTLSVWIPIGFIKTIYESFINPLIKFFNQDHNLSSSYTTPPRVVIISGGSSGIGAHLVQLYACPQTVLIILGRDQERLEHVAKVAKSLGCASLETHSIDYAHDDAEEKIKSMIHQVKEKYGVIDEIFSVAGTVTFTDDQEGESERWGAKTAKRLTQVNVASTYAFIMNSWEIMKTQRHGKICIIASSAALFGPPQFAFYGASKANLLSFSQSLRSISTPYNINVNCICPGFIESGMTADMLSAGSTMPPMMLADTLQMAQRIRLAINQNQSVVVWPLNQVLPLLLASKLNWLNADLGRWVASKIGVTGEMVS